MAEMNDQQLLRFNRQIMVPGFDISGQEKLLDSTVLIIGLGGLGSPAALYLAAAGVGHLILADADVVEETNLQRQIAHQENSIGQSKVESAKISISAINSNCRVETVRQQLSGELLRDTVACADLVLDCTDNFQSRFEINQYCCDLGKPLVSAAAIRAEAQLSVFDFRDKHSPCYQCLYQPGDTQAPSCSENGVLAPLVGVIGSMQALEAIKILANYGEPMVGKLLTFDASLSQWQSFILKKDPHCEVCGK